MNEILSRAIADATAALEPVVPTPTGDLGFGSDLSCTDDLTPDVAELDGSDPTIVAQAIYRRLITPRGRLLDDPDYGFDVRGLLHRPTTQTDLFGMQGQIRNEIRKDDRVDTDGLSVTVIMTSAVQLDIEISGRTVTGEDFSLTMAVTDGGVLLKELAH